MEKLNQMLVGFLLGLTCSFVLELTVSPKEKKPHGNLWDASQQLC